MLRMQYIYIILILSMFSLHGMDQNDFDSEEETEIVTSDLYFHFRPSVSDIFAQTDNDLTV